MRDACYEIPEYMHTHNFCLHRSGHGQPAHTTSLAIIHGVAFRFGLIQLPPSPPFFGSTVLITPQPSAALPVQDPLFSMQWHYGGVGPGVYRSGLTYGMNLPAHAPAPPPLETLWTASDGDGRAKPAEMAHTITSRSGNGNVPPLPSFRVNPPSKPYPTQTSPP